MDGNKNFNSLRWMMCNQIRKGNLWLGKIFLITYKPKKKNKNIFSGSKYVYMGLLYFSEFKYFSELCI